MLTIKGLAYALWLALCSWAPPGDQTRAWREPEAAAAGRYFDVAESIARVVLDPAEPPLPLADDDDEARARTGLLLASVASFESAMAERVIDCRKLGPGGSAGPFQSHRARERVCRSVLDAGYVALDMLRESFRICARWPLLDRMSLYTDGVCRTEPRSRVRIGRAQTWWRAHSVAESERLREGWQDWD
jgi:hypothetical protein